MTDRDITWIVAADGARARVFEERVHGGPLHELTEHAVHAAAHAHARAAVGADHAEAKFLHQVAEVVNRASDAQTFQHLVLMAPPKALGELRTLLKATSLAKVRDADPHERTSEDPVKLRESLRHLRTY